MTYGSLFSGIAGIDAGFSRAGLVPKWHAEIDKSCITVLRRIWPDAVIHGDIRGLLSNPPEPVDLLCGGDPCPKHSKARSNGASKHPDLSGYFLALVGRLRPEWVVRENVPSSTVGHFATALEFLGYGAVVIRVDAANITGQSRQRDIIVARHQATWSSVRQLFRDCSDSAGHRAKSFGQRDILPCLTANRYRYDTRDGYVYEQNGLRVLDAEERETVAGFPCGWTDGVSEAARAKMCGNSALMQWFEWIGGRIIESLRRAA